MNDHRMRRLAVAGIAVLGLALVPAAQAKPAPIPDTIKVAEGNRVFLAAHATGVQIYSCTATGWTFVAPRATLTDERGRAIIDHFAGPTWKYRDGSQVVGRVEAPATVDPTAIPWLRLAAASTTPGRLGRTTFIQRINTRGGLAPAASLCGAQNAGAQVEVPYAADYVFWEKACRRD
jgi:FtsP/CotA-like multicopper oxidase with cupredoxin domain